MDRRGSRGSQEARSSRKKRKPHLSGAWRRIPKRGHRQGKPDRNQTERRRRLRAREGPVPRASAQMGASAYHSAPRRPATLRRRRRSRSRNFAGERPGARNGLWLSRDRRDATAAVGGHSSIRLPVAAGRSEERRFCLLRAHAVRRPVLLRRPLPNGLSVVAAATDPAGARAPRHREFMAAVVRRYAPICRSVFPNTQIRPGASAPASRRVDADWIRSGRKLSLRAMVST